MFENIVNFFKKLKKNDKGIDSKSKETAKERLHLVLMQDRANVSADFLDMMKQEIIEVIKKYIDIDEKAIDVKLTNKMNDDGTVGAPALYANIPIVTIKNEARKVDKEDEEKNVDVELEENKTEENNVKENVDTEEAEEIKIEEPDRDKNNDANNKDNENNTKENPEEKNINNNQNASEKNENEDKNKVDEEEAKKEKANK
ncbi:MAG: cell division topological specificity factor MinE [Clostridia bacterium]|jgi:cell division topological specificity factor|nr:cell division topological specificity factor MinE [Clostridia bacterium]